MKTTPPKLLALATRGDELLARARRTLAQADTEPLKQLLARIPARLSREDQPVRVVFAGQYSSGKSLILKLLTGRDDIVSGAGITTEEAHAYDWNGVHVVDTPGVHTGIRRDHDETSYREIAAADLLVFVVTNELFDAHLGQHFRKLAIERDKGHELMLVVNKMDREHQGNTPEARAIKTEGLRKVVSPFTPEDLRTTFLSANDALRAETAAKPELAAALTRRSNFAEYVQAFDGFVRERGLAGRFSTAAYELEQVLVEALAADTSGDEDADGVEELLVQKRRALLEAQRRIKDRVEAKVRSFANRVEGEGRKTAELVHGEADEAGVKAGIQQAQARVEQTIAELGKTVDGVVGEEFEALRGKVQAIADSELAKALLPKLLEAIETATDGKLDQVDLKKINAAAGHASKLGEFLLANSFKPGASTFAGLLKLNRYTGTQTHSFVKGFGHLVGKSFKPWEAAKWTRAVANVGRGLAVLGALVGVGAQILDDIQQAKREKQLRETRGDVRAGFNDAAHEIVLHFDKATGKFISENLMPEIAETDRQLEELRAMQTRKGARADELNGLLKETRQFIRDLHAETA